MSVRVPSYRHHKGSGQALVQINGERICLGKYGSDESRQKYRRILSEFLTGSDSGSVSIPADQSSDLTINELILQFYKHAQTYYVKDGRPTNESRPQCNASAQCTVAHPQQNSAQKTTS